VPIARSGHWRCSYGSKVEKLEVALAQNTPFEDDVIELAPKFISAEARERAPTASGLGGGDSASPSGPGSIR
jgi:hypothetical protein